MPKNSTKDTKDKALHELSEEELLHVMATKARELLRKYGLHVLFGVAILLLVIVGTQSLRRGAVEGDLAAQQRLAAQQPISVLQNWAANYGWNKQVQDSYDAMVAECSDILDKYPSSGAAPWARLRLAQLYAMKHEWNKALGQYETILDKNDRDVLRSAALAGKASITEELAAAALDDSGSIDTAKQAQLFADAAAIYAELGEAMTMYLLDAGRCYEMAGKTEEATKVYTTVAGTEDDEMIKAAAEDRLAALKRGGRYVYSPPPYVPAPTVEAAVPDYTSDLDTTVDDDTDVSEETPSAETLIDEEPAE